MIYIFIEVNKTAFVKLLPPIVNSLNTSLQSQLINILHDLGIIDHFIYNKNLFIKETFKKKPNYLKIGSKELILSKHIESFLVFLQNRNRYQINLILI